VKRFCAEARRGEKLAAGGRIAVISNDALGNFVVITPLLQMLREQFKPAVIHYFGGKRTWELQESSDLFDWSFPFHGSSLEEQAKVAAENKGYDLVINVERSDEAKTFTALLCGEDTWVSGPCFQSPGVDLPFQDDDRGRLWEDSCWISPDLTSLYPFLDSPFMGEILCRLCYLDGPIPKYQVPREDAPLAIPPVLISAAATLPEKLWPLENWITLLKDFSTRGLEVGLVGASPCQQRKFWKGDEGEKELVDQGLVVDLRGKMTLPQVVGALGNAELVVTLDNGILHLAVAARQRTVGIYRHGIHRLWAPPSDCLSVIAPPEGASVQDISVDSVLNAVLCAV
jgi:ADP-heptose:LPS heptosyltransferase